MYTRAVFPFTAIVSQELIKLALLLRFAALAGSRRGGLSERLAGRSNRFTSRWVHRRRVYSPLSTAIKCWLVLTPFWMISRNRAPGGICSSSNHTRNPARRSQSTSFRVNATSAWA
jgi:hypothetical protein